MAVLHLSNYFPNSSLYEKIFFHLDQTDVKQAVYSAVRTRKESNYTSSRLSDVNINIRNILKPRDQLFYRLKIRKVFKDVRQNVDFRGINIIHAHTLYSDGGTALKIKKKFNIPYLVAIRATDIYKYQKYRPDLRLWRNSILREASRVLFLSPGLKKAFLKYLGSELKSKIKKKSLIIPNGIDSIFLKQPGNNNKNKRSDANLKLLFVGRFLKKKNICSIIKAVKKINQETNVSLTLVGEGSYKEQILNMIAGESYINYLGPIKNREELRKIYKAHDIFIMISEIETFGLVYIEALSQGTPIIYTHGQGVHGYFKKNTISESVKNYKNIDEIIYKIKKLRKRLDVSLSNECIRNVQQFDWTKIAKDYKKLYTEYL